jgi:REP element-mobilizing transposase RayT
MARPLRHHPKRSVIEIATRTLQARYLLRPSPRMMFILQGILARALARYGIEVHAFFYASNHYHLIISIPAVWDLARFECYLNGNTAREASRLVDWTTAARSTSPETPRHWPSGHVVDTGTYT